MIPKDFGSLGSCLSPFKPAQQRLVWKGDLNCPTPLWTPRLGSNADPFYCTCHRRLCERGTTSITLHRHKCDISPPVKRRTHKSPPAFKRNGHASISCSIRCLQRIFTSNGGRGGQITVGANQRGGSNKVAKPRSEPQRTIPAARPLEGLQGPLGVTASGIRFTSGSN